MVPRLKEQYDKKIAVELQKQFSLKNINMVPKLTKVVLNMGLGSDANDKKKVQNCIEDMSLISGQKPVITKFKKSISNFKTRKGFTAGVKVTLRKQKMYEFLDRLVNIALPRVRDFRGLSKKSFDGKGNFSLGLKEQIVFPEIDYDNLDSLRGMDITIVTSAENDEQGLELLKSFNLPINY